MVTNDELALTRPMDTRHHDIDWLETGHHGLIDRATWKDTGRLQGRTMTLGGLNGALAINGVTQGINNTAKETGDNGNVDDLAGMFYSIAFLDETVTTKDGDTDVVRRPRFRVEDVGSGADTRDEVLTGQGWDVL